MSQYSKVKWMTTAEPRGKFDEDPKQRAGPRLALPIRFYSNVLSLLCLTSELFSISVLQFQIYSFRLIELSSATQKIQSTTEGFGAVLPNMHKISHRLCYFSILSRPTTVFKSQCQ